MSKTVYYKFEVSNGYYGCANTVYLSFDQEDVDIELLDDISNEIMIENADEHSYTHFGWDSDESDAEEWKDYYSNCECNYYEIDYDEWLENNGNSYFVED